MNVLLRFGTHFKASRESRLLFHLCPWTLWLWYNTFLLLSSSHLRTFLICIFLQPHLQIIQSSFINFFWVRDPFIKKKIIITFEYKKCRTMYPNVDPTPKLYNPCI
nr:hypothetical protein Iba_scaffold7170CG0040 [Ipomoea batatas]